MAMPRQVDEIRVEVQSLGVTRLNRPYMVGSRDQKLPATLTLVASADPSMPVTVRVAGSKQGTFRTYREATTTLPTDGRSASLRMPIQWLCDGTARSIPARDGAPLSPPDAASTCDDGYTCKAGRCELSEIETSALPIYAPDSIWGGATSEDGVCYDTLACMLKGKPVVPDANCAIEKPRNADVNVALRVTESGICDSTSTICFVPLDAESSEGWLTSPGGDRVILPPAVCDKLAERTISAVYLSTQCESKTEANPPCGEWSSVPSVQPITSPDAASVPRVKLVTSLLSDGSSKKPCCPLTADGNLLYACVCDPMNKAIAELIVIDLAEPDQAHPVASLNLDPARSVVGFSTATSDGALYFTANRKVQRHPLRPNGTFGSFDVPGSVYETSSLLADPAALYMLASDVTSMGAMMPTGSPVQVIRLSTQGTASALDTGGNRPVFQFDQDASALYLAADTDTGTPGALQRSSSVVRIQKQTGVRTPISAAATLAIDDVLHGGYVGVQVSQSAFALYESALDGDGRRHVQLHSLALDGSEAAAAPTVVLDLLVDPKLTQLTLLGAVDGAPVLSRIDYALDAMGMPTLRSGSILVILASNSEARAIADFSMDYASHGLVSDSDSIYWMNSSGKIWSYPREGLK